MELSAFACHRVLVLLGELVFDLVVLDHVFSLINKLLKVVSGLNLVLSLLVGLFVLLSLFDESFDFLLRESSFLVGDGDV